VVTRGGQIPLLDAFADEEVNDAKCARRRELPVRGELRIVDGHVVGVARDLELALGHARDHRCHRSERILAGRLQLRASGVEQNIVRK
jgi:hypothetical protein